MRSMTVCHRTLSDQPGRGRRRGRLRLPSMPLVLGMLALLSMSACSAELPKMGGHTFSSELRLDVFIIREAGAEPEWSDPQLSFQLAQLIPDLEFRQQLLVSRSEAERIEMLAAFLPTHIDQQRHVLHMKTVAPTNGHGPSSIVS